MPKKKKMQAMIIRFGDWLCPLSSCEVVGFSIPPVLAEGLVCCSGIEARGQDYRSFWNDQQRRLEHAQQSSATSN
jgi:hypothetical protein